MIVDPYLKKISYDSGRREITSSMVAKARRKRRDACGLGAMGGYDAYLRALSYQQQSGYSAMMAQQQSISLYNQLGYGGCAVYVSRCLYCGK